MNTSLPMILSRLLLIASIALYAIAIFSTAFEYEKGSVSGELALLQGWIPALFGLFGLLSGKFDYFGTISWLANPLMLVVWFALLFGSRRTAIFASLGAMCLSLVFLLTHTIPVPDGATMRYVHPKVGCAIWMASMAIGFIAALLLKPEEPKNQGVRRRVM